MPAVHRMNNAIQQINEYPLWICLSVVKTSVTNNSSFQTNLYQRTNQYKLHFLFWTCPVATKTKKQKYFHFSESKFVHIVTNFVSTITIRPPPAKYKIDQHPNITQQISLIFQDQFCLHSLPLPSVFPAWKSPKYEENLSYQVECIGRHKWTNHGIVHAMLPLCKIKTSLLQGTCI